MKVELKKWSLDDKKQLMDICNSVEREYLSDRLPYPYTEECADWWLNMVLEHDGKDGVFRAGKDTVRSMEDLEKLFFIWQEMTEQSEGCQEIEIGEEVETEEGFRFSSLTVKNADRRK